jgi:hypothetical protein
LRPPSLNRHRPHPAATTRGSQRWALPCRFGLTHPTHSPAVSRPPAWAGRGAESPAGSKPPLASADRTSRTQNHCVRRLLRKARVSGLCCVRGGVKAGGHGSELLVV